MKIKFWDRLILFFGALLTAAAGIFLFVGGLQFAGVLGEALPMGTRIVCIAGGAALVLFAIIKAINAAKNINKKPEAPKEEPRKCPFCCSEIAKEATRCPHCTSTLPPYKP